MNENECGDFRYLLMEDGTAKITDCFGHEQSETVTIPETLDGHTVTAIDGRAFVPCDALRKVVLPDSVTELNGNAFRAATFLKAIEVSPTHPVFATEDGVLFNKHEKTLVCHPAMSGKADYTIPDGIRTIGDYAFHGCIGLHSVHIPDSVTAIGSGAFSLCNITSVHIPAGMKYIGENPFAMCMRLRSICVAPENPVFSATDNMLVNENEKTVIGLPRIMVVGSCTIPQGTRTVGKSAFSMCSGLTAVSLPDSLTEIGSMAFENCRTLSSLTIPRNVTVIGNKAFRRCDSLTSVSIPDSVTKIGKLAFDDCSRLTFVTLPASLPGLDLAGVFGERYASITYTVTAGSETEKLCEKAGVRYIPIPVPQFGF